jgi:hypothetical protein
LLKGVNIVKKQRKLMKKNEVEIETIFLSNTRKYIKIYLNLIFETIVFLIGFIINIIQNLNILK